jgi:regulator of protease activity HflC (stomatin/prohibitin superfamily)
MYAESNRSSVNPMFYGVGVVVVIALMLLLSPFTIVGAGERAVVTNLGKVDRVLDSGMHWVTPITESVHTFDVQTQKATVDASASSKDLQDVSTTVAMNYNVNPDGVAALYVTIGEDFESRIVAPAMQEAVKGATAKYTAEELVTKRDKVKADILLALKTRLEASYIQVSEVSITNFQFSESFNQSIEAKVKAEQDALTAKNKLEQVKFEAEQRVATAQAEAEAIRIQAGAINSQGGADYVNLKAIEKWNGILPTQMIPGGTVPFINVKAQN